MNEYKIANHEPSFLPEGKKWNLVWSDEFDDTELDASKWDYRLSMMGTPWPAWTDKGVHLDGNSNAVFTLIEEDGRPVCSQLQTGYNFMDEPVVRTTFGKEHLQWHIGKLKEQKFTHKYGYYEIRCFANGAAERPLPQSYQRPIRLPIFKRRNSQLLFHHINQITGAV